MVDGRVVVGGGQDLGGTKDGCVVGSVPCWPLARGFLADCRRDCRQPLLGHQARPRGEGGGPRGPLRRETQQRAELFSARLRSERGPRASCVMPRYPG